MLIGITGHRSLHEADLPGLRARVRHFFSQLQERHPQLPLVVLSALAEGGDQLATQVALDMGLPVISPLPLAVDSYREDFARPGPRMCLEQQLRQAEVLVLPLHEGADAEAIGRPGPARNQQYADAGMFVSSHCHILLALWDGGSSAAIGGTSPLVGFHLHGTMPGRDVATAALAMLGLDEATLVHHIHAVRLGDSAPAQPARWLTAADGVIAAADLPHTFDVMFRKQVAFNIDCGKYADDIPDSRARAADAAGTGDCAIQRLFRAADCLASNDQRRVSRVLQLTCPIAAATCSAFILCAHAHSQDAMIYLYPVLFVAGIGLATVAKRRDWHRKYLDYRALAEGLRVQSFWPLAGIVHLQNPNYAHDNFAAARKRMDGCSDVAGKRLILRTLGEAALAEHAEWTRMHRERPLEHTRLGG